MARKLLHFVPSTDSFIILDAKHTVTPVFNVDGNSLSGPLIIGTSRNAPLVDSVINLLSN